MNPIDFGFLQALRYKIGPIFGSEDLCVLLYSLVKREKPRVVVELGTGFGVTTAWIAAAMAENGYGTIYTVDNGAGFSASRVRHKFDQFDGVLRPLAGVAAAEDFFATAFQLAGVSNHVRTIKRDIDLVNLQWLDEEIEKDHETTLVDFVFSDFDHSVPAICRLLAAFLPRLTDNASLFIDSASTKMISYYMLEYLMDLLSKNKIPAELLAMANDDAERTRLTQVLSNSVIRLIHLVEHHDRAQNSTAWIKITRPSLLPAGAQNVRI